MTAPQPARRLRSPGAVKCAGVLVSLAVAIGLYTRWGINGVLDRDQSIYAYSGQQMAHGVPPYVSTFDPKGPLASMVAGFGATIARVLGRNDIYGIRLTFFVCSCLTVVAVYLLAARLWRSELVGLVGAIVFACFSGFAEFALSGPDAKTPGILAAVLAMWLLTRRQWFWGGFAASFALLAWQPLVIYPVVAIATAGLVTATPDRWKAVGRAAVGVALPLVAYVVYCALSGALGAMYEAAFAFPAGGVYRPPETVRHRLYRVGVIVHDYYHFSGYLFWVGLVALLCLAVTQVIRHRSERWNAVLDPLVLVVLVTFLAEAAYITYDFQGNSDVYPLLPYGALGLAGAAAAGMQWLRRPVQRRRVEAGVLVALVTLTAFSWFWFDNDPANTNDLRAQRADACAVERMLGAHGRLYAFGDPVPLVMTHRRNPDKYIYLNSGIDAWKVAHTAGGFPAWVAQVKKADPTVVVFGGGWDTALRFRMQDWLESTGYRSHFVGGWHVLLPARARRLARAHDVRLQGKPSPFATDSQGEELPAGGCESQ